MNSARRLPVIWLIPVAAVLVCVALFVHAILQRGPRITIGFASAEGLEPGKTRVRYRDVEIGTLQSLRLTADRTGILADVQLDDPAKLFAPCDTRYWVVRPRIGMTGISGLATVISGSYIAADIGHTSRHCTDFRGLDVPPSITSDQKGKRFTLHANSLESLTAGSPVLFRRAQAGQVLDYSLSRDGSEVVIHVFVNAPFDQYVTPSTRWWHASGIDLRLGSDGFRLETQSVASLLSGGVAFDTTAPFTTQHQASDGTSFALSESRMDALRKAGDGPAAQVVMRFTQSLRGLSVGAPVDFHGVELGQVAAIDVDFNPVTGHIDMVPTLQLYPSRLGKRYREALGNGEGVEGKRLLHRLVADGLRGQLRMGSVLTGQRYIALDFFPHAPVVKLDTTRMPVELPTVPNTLEELQDQIASIVKKIDGVPFDEIGRNLDTTLAGAGSLFQKLDSELVPAARDALAASERSFNAANATLSQDSPLQSDLHQALTELRRTLESLNSLAEYLQRHPESLVWGKSRRE
ncbi:MlaD family protein [Burkholderia sp. Ac-20365]|uniref:PqiB family protein n=1 Tax=Burkholderia sp. Ac-20365 TaxID=2703897 RepID=UPI00197C12C8|nr:MlaD family protein [Burkholderia sp. Ac-20365]MBN3761756.1 MCE family protein [Burkholderia sp. Ac-20365]